MVLPEMASQDGVESISGDDGSADCEGLGRGLPSGSYVLFVSLPDSDYHSGHRVHDERIVDVPMASAPLLLIIEETGRKIPRMHRCKKYLFITKQKIRLSLIDVE